MKKLDPKTDGATTDIVEQNIDKLRDLFPDTFTEGSDEDGPRWKVDFDALREILGNYLEDSQERSSFTWNGKARARRIAQTPSTGTLRPCPEESGNWDTTKNLFIEGDNLEVLKLLQKSYHKKVKMIYIDPPYNTGKDFIYPDDFRDNIKNYLELTGQTDGEGRRLSANAETSGRYHTDWLNMMYPRLKLARNLLRDDGVIFISIDDNEVANLRKLCDEVFGEENHIVTISYKNKAGAGARPRGYIIVHEYVLCYAKNAALITALDVPLSNNRIDLYTKKDEKFATRGPYGTWALATTSMDDRPNLRFPIYHDGEEIWPEKQWLWSKERVEEAQRNNELVFNKKRDGSWSVRFKRYLKNADGIVNTGTPTSHLDGPYTHAGTKEMDALFPSRVFPFPKPTELIIRLLECRVNGQESDSDLILDFFAGACSTAHAVLDLNKEDGGNRKFIMVQLPEPCDEKSEAFKAGYKTIADIGKERIRRVIKKIEVEQSQKAKNTEGNLPGMTDEVPELDLGFKVFKLDASNIKPWDADFDNLEEQLELAVENIKPDRSEADVLYELLLKYGLDLAVPIEERKTDGKTVYIIGAGALIVCLADKISLDVVEGIAALKEELKPEVMRVVFKDSGFADDVVKTNAVQILRQAGIEDVKSL